MNLLKLIQAIENLIYEIALWIIFIPKTIFKTIFYPRWSYTYVVSEMEKGEDKRFDDHLSPVILWFFTSIIPYYFFFEEKFNYFISSKFHDAFVNQTFEEKILISSFTIIWPLTYSLGVILLSRKKVTKENLKPYFFMQCYCLSPFALISNIINYFLASELSSELFILMFLIPFLFLIFYEFIHVRQNFKMGQLKTLGFCSLLAIIAMAAFEGFIIIADVVI